MVGFLVDERLSILDRLKMVFLFCEDEEEEGASRQVRTLRHLERLDQFHFLCSW